MCNIFVWQIVIKYLWFIYIYSGRWSVLADVDKLLWTYGNPNVRAKHAHDVSADCVSVFDTILVHASRT